MNSDNIPEEDFTIEEIDVENDPFAAIDGPAKNYAPGQARDNYGRFASGGGRADSRARLTKAAGKYSSAKDFIAGESETAYHGSNVNIDKFSTEHGAQGLIWFAGKKSDITNGESGAQGTKYIMERQLTAKKWADWDAYDRKELYRIEEEYEGIKLVDADGQTTYAMLNDHFIESKESMTEIYDAAHKPAKNYAPGQPRDSQGQFSTTGSSSISMGLRNEAKKYNSAAEFYDAQDKLYHGTTEKIDGDLRMPLYTTSSKKYAQVYADSTAASSMGRSTIKKGDGKAVHEFALNPAARTFDITNSRHAAMVENYWSESVSGAFYPTSRGQLDWTEGEGLAEFIDKKNLPFDVVLLDEGGGGFDPSGAFVEDKGLSSLILTKDAIFTQPEALTIFDSANKKKTKNYAPGQARDNYGRFATGTSTRPQPKGPKEGALGEVETNETSSPAAEELYDYMDGDLKEMPGDPYGTGGEDSFEMMDKNGRDTFINEHIQQHTEGDYDETIAQYVGKKDYSAVNTFLRNPEFLSHPNHKDEVKRLEKLTSDLKKATTSDVVSKDFSSYRSGMFDENYVNNLRPGTYMNDTGIVSTSLSAIYSNEFGARRVASANSKRESESDPIQGAVLFRMNHKEGQTGIYADTRRTAGGTEFEWIPAYGSQFYITQATKYEDSNNQYVGAIVDVDVYQSGIPKGYIQTKMFNSITKSINAAKSTSDPNRFVWEAGDIELFVPAGEAKNYAPGQPRDKDGQFASSGSTSYTDRSGDNSYNLSKTYGEPTTDNASYSEEEQRAARYYKLAGYETMNDVLRYGYSTIDEKLARKSIKSLNDAKKISLKENTVLWRGGEFDTRIDVGDTISDRGYTSTSFDKSVAKDFATERDTGGYKYLFKINADKGTEGLFIGGDEAEWLLPTRSSIKIDSVSEEDDDGVITIGASYE